MLKLNLPSFEYRIQKVEDKVMIFDVIRKKFVFLTPEEWVRQHFVHFLLHDLGCPKALIKIETGLLYNQRAKRSDIVVYNRSGLPWMVVECKAPDQALNDNTLSQASVYNTQFKAKYLAITNGIKHICCEINWAERSSNIIHAFPFFDEGSV
jgi:hypothetical protein